MNGNIMLWFVIICTVFLFAMAFKKQLGYLLTFLIRASIGVIGFSIVNIVSGSFGVVVGTNLVTIIVVGILGIPGFISLYIAQLML